MIEVLDCIYIFHIFVNFFTGYIDGETQKVAVLNLYSIFWKYVKTWLLFDGMAGNLTSTCMFLLLSHCVGIDTSLIKSKNN